MPLAELIIELTADTASLRADFDKATKYAKDASEQITAAFSGLKDVFAGVTGGLSFAGIADGLEHVVKSTASAGAEIEKLEGITGLGSEALSGLRAVAMESGESFTGLGSTLARAGKNIEDAFIHPAGNAGKVLGALFTQAEVESLKLARPEERIQAVARKIFDLTDAAEVDYTAAAMFGRGWAENAETLKKLGEEGFGTAIAKANVMGIAMTESEARLSKLADEIVSHIDISLTGLAQGFGRLAIEAAIPVTPLTQVAEKLDEIEAHHGLNLDDVIGGGKEISGPELGAGLPVWGQTLQLPKSRLEDLIAQEGKPRAPHAATGNLNAGVEEAYRALQEQIRTEEQADRLLREMTPHVGALAEAYEHYAERLEKINKLQGQFRLGEGEATMAQLNAANVAMWSGEIDKLAENSGVLMPRGMNQQQLQAMIPAFQMLPQASKDVNTLNQSAMQFGKQMSGAFTKMVLYGKNFNQILTSMLTYIGEAIIKATVFQGIWQLLGQGQGGGVTGLLSNFFGGLAGGRQSGGPVTAGELYMVAETGPELFAPGVSGQIIPGGTAQGGDTYNIDARGAHPGAERDILRALDMVRKRSIGDSLVAAYEYQARGGTL